MGDPFQAGHLIMQDTLDLFGTGYSVYQDQRNWKFQNKVFDYQKDLQNKIFEREDTAVQRRRADLEAAGMNPNLAAGSAASAGAVVGTNAGSGGQTVQKGNYMQNYGAYLDAKMAQEQIKKAEYENLLLEDQYASNQAKLKRQEQQDKIEQFYNDVKNVFDTGTDPGKYYVEIAGTADFSFPVLTPKIDRPLDQWQGNLDQGFLIELKDSRVWNELKNGYDISLNEKDMSDYQRLMMSNESEWQTSDKWFDRGRQILNTIFGNGGALNTVNNLRKPRTKRVLVPMFR